MPKNVEIERLEWDSAFFGFSVGRFAERSLAIERQEVLHAMHRLSYDLAYWNSPHKLPQEFEPDFVVSQVTFRKSLSIGDLPVSNRQSLIATSYPKQIASEPLRQLAYEAGWSSRFQMDRNIDRAMFHKLYDLWIDRSCLREIADEVLVVQAAEEICGFVTLKVSGDDAQICLIAVGANYRGRGIGGLLMTSVQDHAITCGCTSLKVVTQLNNVAAIKLYEKHEMKLVDTQHWYHIWRNSVES